MIAYNKIIYISLLVLLLFSPQWSWTYAPIGEHSENPAIESKKAQVSINNYSPNASLPNEITYSEPITISKGGIYEGNWESKNSLIPAVRIQTKEPVIIKNSNIRSAGHCIEVRTIGANITIQNTNGYGLTPTEPKTPRGRFLHAANFSNAVVENNYLEHTSGIYFLDYKGNKTTKETIKVRFNKAKNIDGRDMNNVKAPRHVQFLQLNKVTDVPGIEISWNLIVNEYGHSIVEDNISIYLSSGTEDSPIKIHHNFIDGAYPLDASRQDYTGGGIMCDASWNPKTLKTTSYVHAYNNHIVRTCNYGLGIAGGNNNKYYNNRIVSVNQTPDGKTVRGRGNNGIQIWNYKHPKYGKAPATIYYNNSAQGNFVGYINQGEKATRADFWIGGKGTECIDCSIIPLPDPITKATEDAEFDLWLKEVKENNIRVGSVVQ